MLSRRPIKAKLIFGVASLTLIVGMLAFSSFSGVYGYRRLAMSISHRAAEMPPAAELTQAASELRFSFKRVAPLRDFPSLADGNPSYAQYEFRGHLAGVRHALANYKRLLTTAPADSFDPHIGDLRAEQKTVESIERSLKNIEKLYGEEDWVFEQVNYDLMADEIDRLNDSAAELPLHLQRRMSAFRDEVRGQYRTWIVLTWTTTILAPVLMASLAFLFHRWFFQPLNVLIASSRRVAAGEFEHRVLLRSHDEMAELANALNAMTIRFQEVREDLKRQVQQRTKEVVRSEQLASVGLLAAGVAHEINNPLAAIALAAESLESRVDELVEDVEEEVAVGALDARDRSSGEISDHEHDARDDDSRRQNERAANARIIQDYLRKIQKEAFRCKGITERLLDFSRLGDIEKHDTDLRSLIQDVIDMVRHLGQYRRKTIEFRAERYVAALANEQELKQVVLNLITNALDSLDPDGTVWVELHEQNGRAEIVVRDNGCGMTQEVLDQLFEPFFTRRRDGQGTGLGLSITYRIVHEHGGEITAHSDGPGKGSCMRVTLPLTNAESRHEEKRQVA